LRLLKCFGLIKNLQTYAKYLNCVKQIIDIYAIIEEKSHWIFLIDSESFHDNEVTFDDILLENDEIEKFEKPINDRR
jgi:hypothetical protein